MKNYSRHYGELLQRQAEKFPDKNFLTIDTQSYTYQQMQNLVSELTHHAQEQGLQGRILVLADSFLLQCAAFCALQNLGACPILLHHDLQKEEIQAILQHNHLQGFVHISDEISSLTYTTTIFSATYLPSTDIMGVLSSGSTGTPKVMYRTYESWAGFFPIQNEIFQVHSQTILFLHGSLSFTGNLNTLLSVLFAGGTIVTSEKIACRHWEQLMRQHDVNTIYLVPTKLRLWIAKVKEPLPLIHMLFTGSQLLHEKTWRQLRQFLPQAKFLLYYGASELNYITYTIADDPARTPENLGHPFPHVKVTIGEDGLIYVNTQWHVSGLKPPFTVKDRGYLNAQGALIFQGRDADFINKGGVKFSAQKIETKIRRINGVENVAVLAYDDEIRGKAIAAFVVCANHKKEGIVRASLRHHLKPVEMPDTLQFLEVLPLNDRGKIDKRRLLAEL